MQLHAQSLYIKSCKCSVQLHLYTCIYNPGSIVDICAYKVVDFVYVLTMVEDHDGDDGKRIAVE